VWTPKRVLLLALGFALLFTLYLTYAHYLGGIDGLPPLPEACLPPPSGDDLADLSEPPRTWVEERLVMAFGEACPELRRHIRLELHSKGIVLATDDFHIMRSDERDVDGKVREGQVRLQPLSLALFNKKTPPGQFPEISTVRAKIAYLEFDRPINNMGDMAKAKIVAAELRDDIHLVNNHRKPRSSNDELYIRIAKGPVFYRQRTHLAPDARTEPDIWTKDTLNLVDSQTKPFPTKIDAVGMNLFLASESSAQNASATAARKQRAESISGVQRVVLLSNVRMDLYTDSHSGFLSTGETAGKSPPKVKGTATTPLDKTEVIIETPGTFFYEAEKDFAQFDVPANGGQLSPHRVHVTRITKPGQHDQLYCEHLELQFRRKKTGEGKPARPADDQGMELDIETAHATGKDVTLASDAETLEVLEANDFRYNALKRETVVTGAGEVAVFKEGHELWARELRLQETAGVQQMTALGPGRIGLYDRATHKRSVTAAWKKTLVSSKDGDLDLLILTGEANFQDTEHDQHLKAEELKVWLEPSRQPVANLRVEPGGSSAGSNQGSRRPQRVEATGHVATRSPEMIIHDTDKLILTFKDAPPGIRLPANPGPGTPTGSQAVPAVAGNAQAVGKNEPVKPARPIDLSAHLVEARILRQEGGKNELDRLWTEGQVQVHQAPEKPNEKGLDIKGETLELIKQAEGNRLVVTGDVAELQIDKLFIRGPQIHVDQAENESWVNGDGALTMTGDTSFNGTKLDHEVDMTIYWHQYMHFKGAHAQFTGSVQAEQENARLACQSLQVYLDRPVSFRDGQKNGPPAKVDRMVCDKSVSVEDSEYQNGRRIKYQKIECLELTVNNTDGLANAAGPGTVRIHQRGDAGSPLAPSTGQPGRPGTPGKEQEMKLTIIHFGGRMWANNKTHVAKFFDDVEVVHFATDDKDLQPNLERLPVDAIYLRCSDCLEVLNRPENGKSNQQLEGTGRVRCETAEYRAQCEKVTYHEGKDQLIFDGGDGWAILTKLGAPGGQGQTSYAKRFIYNRKTREMSSEGARGFQGVTPP
jgi:hypothetical protein